jgi:hypothetical protein
MANRAHRYQVGLHDNRGHYALAETFATSYGDAVLYGPFAGMRYPTRRIASMPRRLGIYEAELHPWLETVLGSAPRRCVNIGAADGYYAVGLAMRGLAVDAFEMSSVARGEIRDLARINGVCVNVLRRATASRLCQLDLERAVVISDCEGAELDIFDEDTIRALQTATVIIEVHEDVRPGAQHILRERFEATHLCRYAAPSDHNRREVRELSMFSAAERTEILGEMRVGHTPWLMFEPR